MIVDLERNDLSRVCEPGTIRWPELMGQHELAGVTHLVSTVEGRLRPDAGLAEILRATFPGGSITGAPKIAALDHIARLEPVGRGASMGALGTIRGNGDFELALTIRTFAIADGWIHLWVGGGVVWDSAARGGDRGVVGQGPAAARGGRRPACLRSDDAARRRDRRARPRRPGRAGLPRGRRRPPPRCCGVRDDPRVRRPAVPARRSPQALPVLRTGARAARAGRRGGARRAARRGRAAGSRAAPVPHVARRRRDRRTLPAGLDDVRLHGVTLESFDVGPPPALLAGAKTTSYDVSFAARREAERTGADDALLVGAGYVLEGTTAILSSRRATRLRTGRCRPVCCRRGPSLSSFSVEPAHGASLSPQSCSRPTRRS